jgi:hypothetical protein
MPRPKGSVNKNKINNKKIAVKELTCTMCGKSQKPSMHYQSFNPLHATGYLPYCKACLRNMCFDSNGNFNINKFKDMLKLIDRPFLYDILKTSAEDKMDTIGMYMKNIAMVQYRNFGWRDSIFLPETSNEFNYNSITADLNQEKKSKFILTDELIEKWGYGYKIEEYEAFERKYSFLKNNYTEKTNMHSEALFNYIRYRCKEEMATARGDVKEAKDWGELANKAATAAKINPSQLSKADLSDGLSTFSELSQAVEKEVDIIPILPRLKYRPNDALDFNIWCYVNYERFLSGLPPCNYEDIYAFYDKRKKEYIKQYGDPYGIFSDDPSEKNRDNIKNFIQDEGE